MMGDSAGREAERLACTRRHGARGPSLSACTHSDPPTPSGVEMTKLLIEYGVDLDARTPKDWTPLSYCRAKGKYGATEEKGIYPEVDVGSVMPALARHGGVQLTCSHVWAHVGN